MVKVVYFLSVLCLTLLDLIFFGKILIDLVGDQFFIRV